MTMLPINTESNTINYKSKLNTADNKAMFLADKLVAGDNVTLTLITSSDSTYGSQLRFDAAVTSSDTYKVKVSTSDTPQFLETAIDGGDGITVAFTSNLATVSYSGELNNNSDVNIVTASLTTGSMLTWHAVASAWLSAFKVSTSTTTLGSATATVCLESQVKKYVDGADYGNRFYNHLSAMPSDFSILYYVSVSSADSYSSLTTLFPLRSVASGALTNATLLSSTGGALGYVGELTMPS